MARDIHLAGCAAAPGEHCACEVRRYWQILWLTLLVIAIQLAGSIVSGSLALLADTAHAFLDGASAGISVYVAHTARFHADPHTLRVRWMRINGGLLLVALAWIAFEAFHRFEHPRPVAGWEVMLVAGIGAGINVWQHRLVPHDHSVTARAQRLHVLSDLFSSIVVLVGGGIIWATGSYIVDPALSLFVAAIIGYSTLKMMLAPQAEAGHCGHSH